MMSVVNVQRAVLLQFISRMKPVNLPSPGPKLFLMKMSLPTTVTNKKQTKHNTEFSFCQCRPSQTAQEPTSKSTDL